jgi:hypothetical protein
MRGKGEEEKREEDKEEEKNKFSNLPFSEIH